MNILAKRIRLVNVHPYNCGMNQFSGYTSSSFTKTGKLWWDEGFGGQGAIYSSIDGQSDPYPMAEVDNASRVITYVGILGYRHSSYALVDMRIHDINVVCDLSRRNPGAPDIPPPSEDPEESMYYDGSLEGRFSTLETSSHNDGLEDASSQFVDGEWTGPWPTYHLYILGPASELLLHLTIDILFEISIASLNIVEWFLELFGLDYEQYEYLTGTLAKLVDKVLFAAMLLFLEVGTSAMMLFDATKSPAALVAGVAFFAFAAGIAHTLAYFYFTELSDPLAAGWLWFTLFFTALCNLVGGALLENYSSGMKKLAGKTAWLICKLGGSVKWYPQSTRVRFGWASAIALLGIIALSLYNWIQYGTYME